MKKTDPFLPVAFSLLMLIFVLFIVWYLPSINRLRFSLQDTVKSLETSRGRERKQQYEYDEAESALPQVQEELDRILPLCEAAKLEVKALKEERKKLRNERKELESRKIPADKEE